MVTYGEASESVAVTVTLAALSSTVVTSAIETDGGGQIFNVPVGWSIEALLALVSVSITVSLIKSGPSASLEVRLLIGTSMVLLVSPASKVRVPLKAV